MKTNQFDFIISYLKKEKIKIDFDEFKFQVETHPDFPSLYAFSDTLSFFKIDNLAVKIENEQIEYLPDRFVALLQAEKEAPFLAFVEKINNKFSYKKKNKKQSYTEAEFLNLCKNIVLVVEQTDKTEIVAPKKNATPYIIGVSFILLSILGVGIPMQFAITPMLILFLSLSGVFLTLEVLKQEFGVDSSFASAVCGSGASLKSSCESVITSKGTKLFSNIGLSDLSVIFFFGQLIGLFLMSRSNDFENFINYSLITTLLGLPVILYSLYYQWQVEKKWCTICLLIAGLLVLEMVTFSNFGSFRTLVFNGISLFSFLLGFSVVVMVWLMLKPKIKSYFRLKSSEITSLRFKRNYDLFKLALLDSKSYNYDTLDSEIYVGNGDAQLKLTLVTNPFCGHCIKMHGQLEKILDKYTDDLRVNIRFNYNFQEPEEKSKFLHHRLLEIYFQEGQNKFMNALGIWFNTKNMEEWNLNFGAAEVIPKIGKIFKKQFKENIKNELLFTPALIVGQQQYPDTYDREDLILFIKDLLDDKDFIIRQSNIVKKEVVQN
ncbi:thioredoxin domain-containing protein [Flavobacteriaceae bacterium F08102]|nr:thioredoxin domain-containing protein [Flavobacteriaceae bacterium F08102]